MILKPVCNERWIIEINHKFTEYIIYRLRLKDPRKKDYNL